MEYEQHYVVRCFIYMQTLSFQDHYFLLLVCSAYNEENFLQNTDCKYYFLVEIRLNYSVLGSGTYHQD